MACPFSKRSDSFPRQASAAEHSTWNIEDDLAEVPVDALALTHLQLAIQLLTGPSNADINTAVTSLISKYSERWPGITNLKVSGETLQIYPNYDYLSDIQDSLLAMEESSASEILVLLGEELITTCCTGIVERAFQCLGTDLQEFLGSLDGVYDVLKLKEKQEEGEDVMGNDDDEDDSGNTGFVCAGQGELIFTTERPVIAWLLLGSLKALTYILYHHDVSIVIEPVDGDSKRYRYLFRVPDDDDSSLVDDIAVRQRKMKLDKTKMSTIADLKISPATFCKAFPWHFIMNENLELLQMGKGFSKLYRGSLVANGRVATTYFKFKRPHKLLINFNAIVRRTNTPFLIALRSPPGKPDFQSHGLEIKGQMVFCPESNTLLFIGSPFLDGLDGLTRNGLFISDIPLHDATREVILVGEQTKAQDGLRRRMDKLKSSIEEGNIAVMKERKKNVSLLHLIFPAEIAERLWLGEEIEATSHPDVTMLFSDIVGFTSICSTASPFTVITMLESLYKDFDEFCGIFDVYKVETIGDAYCVASGLHRAGIYDAHKVAWMALRMINACSKHHTHDGQHIRMRIGLHTGTVLAGVVGRKMPRYCLFGHNVTIANKFESGSVELKINISPTTKEWLLKHSGFDQFELEPRDPSCLPKEYTNAEGTCYFLEGYTHPGLDDSASPTDHIEAAMNQIMPS